MLEGALPTALYSESMLNRELSINELIRERHSEEIFAFQHHVSGLAGYFSQSL